MQELGGHRGEGAYFRENMVVIKWIAESNLQLNLESNPIEPDPIKPRYNRVWERELESNRIQSSRRKRAGSPKSVAIESKAWERDLHCGATVKES